jgi:hypothetical protein
LSPGPPYRKGGAWLRLAVTEATLGSAGIRPDLTNSTK